MKTLAACTAVSVMVANVAFAEPVEIMLSDRLDGDLDYYCLDISGAKENANIDGGLQTHTCYGYQGEAGIDQIFDADLFGRNALYMTEFEVCATLSSTDAGTPVGLAACDESESQQIAFTADGQLSPVSAPGMCFTAGEDTRRGRGGTSEHQIKSLTLESCSEDLAQYQSWEPRAQ